MKKIILKISIALVALFSLSSCFNLDEQVFDRVDASVYYDSESSLQGAIAAIYYRSAMTWCEYFCYLQEFSADQFAWRTWNGGLWGWDEALKFNLSAQTWTSESTIIKQAWETAWEAIGLCNTFINDVSGLNPENLGMTEDQVRAYVSEVRTVRAWAYYQIYELWGGALPLCTSATGDVPGSIDEDFNVGCQKMWDFIATELDETVADLPVNTPNRANQALNRILKARLFINSEVFTGTAKFTECANLCQEIIDGKYGKYQIVDDYRTIYNIDNDKCAEIVFAWPFEDGQLDANWMRVMSIPSSGELDKYLGGSPISKQSGWNCTLLAPSYDNSANFYDLGVACSEDAKCFLDEPYGDKLGAVYARMNSKDKRRQNVEIDGTTGTWNGGMMFAGIMRDKATGAALELDADRQGQPIIFVDQVGTFLNLGKNLETVMSPRWGETNSGIRIMKYPQYPESTGINFKNIDEVEMRLAEVVYMLAECKLRAGDAAEAQRLVNSVRKRYFSTVDWATAQNDLGRGFTAVDMDWMLSEWGLEYLAEGRRRRTDLRRFDKFTQGQWWFFGRATDDTFNYPAKRDRKYEWFPLPATALSVNPGLVQNPNYR